MNQKIGFFIFAAMLLALLAVTALAAETVYVDGVGTAELITDGDATLIVTPAESAVVTYTDGSEETVWFANRPGDMNQDGSVTVADVLLLVRALLNGETPKNFDMNGDGVVSLLDVVRAMKLCIQ